jgi:hypothetical protein
MELCRHHPADGEIVRLFALFHDSCRHDEYADPGHGPRGAQLAIDFRLFHLLKIPNIQYPISLPHSPCRIHNGAPPQSNPTLAVCLDADRLDLGRVGITPDPQLLSTTTAREMAKLGTISKSQTIDRCGKVSKKISSHSSSLPLGVLLRKPYLLGFSELEIS